RHRMKSTALAVAAGLAGLLLGGLAAAQQHDPKAHGGGHGAAHSQAPEDARVAVAIPEPMKSHMLANMRDHLLAIQEIQLALAGGKHNEAARIAEERLGMSSLRVHGAHDVA